MIRPPSSEPSDELELLLAEQLDYYRAVAPRYGETAIPDVGEATLRAAGRELSDAIEAFGFVGDVLELACGPGTWTESLTHATRGPFYWGGGGRAGDDRP